LYLGFLVLAGRIVDLQIIRGEYYRVLSEGNRIRRVPIIAARGRMLARGGEVLVGNSMVKKRVIFDPEKGYKKVDDIKGAAEDEIIQEWVRDYLLGPDFAHVSGYLGEVNEDELGKIRAQCPDKGPRRLGSQVGRGGLEEEYDCNLRGLDGEELVEVDAQGKMVRVLGRKNPFPGEDLKATIHYGLQKKVAQVLSDKKGAVVVSDTNGEVLALYSSPSYDPNIFVKKDKTDKILNLLKDKGLPIFNRVIGGTYHPGSTFKPVVAVAALEEDKIDEEFVYEDKGEITVETPYGTFTYSNWYFTQYGGIEGKINLTRALARSTDTFFYKIGELVGVDKLFEWANEFGLSAKTGVDLPGEVSGLIPTPEWKLREKGERWFLGNTYHMSIGQGDIAVTPLAINTAIFTIASGGEFCSPSLVKKPECRRLAIDKGSVSLVKEGMVGACSSGGTGVPFFDFEEKSGVAIACKTGTAETEEEDITHAWFTAFGPADFPEIVVTVLIERGGEGSRVAGPIAREIFDYWFGVERDGR
jgi:penicillin-binding protein 2